jgi:exodeoxyribonuclease VII large subunit
MEKIIFDGSDMDDIAITTKTYSLQDILMSVQSVLQKAYLNKSYWVKCELSRITLHGQSGHCYLELIEKNEIAIVAQLKGIIWSYKYPLINEKFKAVTSSLLTGGMKVLLLCSVSFHPVHGLSLIITDIEPSFTLGEMARMKNESIAKLKSEGLFDLNKKKKLPLLPKRIAIISVETSRGYHDFMSTFFNHDAKFSISFKLFDAVLQGENAVPTIIKAIKNILNDQEAFDAITIIRGGAGDAGLSCYDEYALASLVASSPLPVITGIGHATNETVVEMIAFKNCITPTAAATFFLDKFDQQSQLVNEIEYKFQESIKLLLSDERQSLSINTERFYLLVSNHMNLQSYQLSNLTSSLPAYTGAFFSFKNQQLKQSIQVVGNVIRLNKNLILIMEVSKIISEIQQRIENKTLIEKNKLQEFIFIIKDTTAQLKNKNESIDHIQDKINLLDPKNTLKRGYSITRLKGKAITDSSMITAEDVIETELAIGKLISTVKKQK